MVNELNIKNSRLIICDIDKTIIKGPFVNFIELIWKITKSRQIMEFLFLLQTKFKLYRVNEKLLHNVLSKPYTSVIYMTARKDSKYTMRLLEELSGGAGFILCSLGSDNPAKDKLIKTQQILKKMNDYLGEDRKIDKTECLLIDDNFNTRCVFSYAGFKVLNPLEDRV